MTNWKTVRFDPTWEEPIDPEILPLCDALNAAGLETIGSCWGHCRDWPYALISGNIADEQAECLQRYLLAHCDECEVNYLPCMRKDIVSIGSVEAENGHYWDLEIHASELYCDTPAADVGKAYLRILDHVVSLIRDWATEAG